MTALDAMVRAIAISLIREAQQEGPQSARQHYEMLRDAMTADEREVFARLVVEAALTLDELQRLAGEANEERNEAEK